jgi:hypothetical protein
MASGSGGPSGQLLNYSVAANTTASSRAATITVTANNGTNTSTATLSITQAPAQLQVSPNFIVLRGSVTQQFTALLNGQAAAATWSVQGGIGTINASTGLLTTSPTSGLITGTVTATLPSGQTAAAAVQVTVATSAYVSPSPGSSGPTQDAVISVTYQFSADQDVWTQAAKISPAEVLITANPGSSGSPPSPGGSCHVKWLVSGANWLSLADDAGNPGPWTQMLPSGTLSNSQCTVDLSGSSVTWYTGFAILNLKYRFTPAFVGTKNVWLHLTSTYPNPPALFENIIWTNVGTWTVTPDLWLPGLNVTAGTRVWQAPQSVTATGVIAGTADVTFESGTVIRLLPEFRATAGTAGVTFRARIP